MIVYAAADTKYFMEHGVEFINSCISNENKCLVTIFNNFEEPLPEQQRKLQEFMTAKLDSLHPNRDKFLIAPEFFKFQYDCEIQDTKAYYASFRFLHLPFIMKSFPDEDILVLDIDSVVRKNLPSIEEDLGIYLRLNNTLGANPYEINGMKVAAGILYVSKHRIDFAEAIKDNILNNPVIWFNDQHAIRKAYFNSSMPNTSVLDFNGSKWLDWEFKDDTYIWTGKGQRKFDNRYLDEKERFT